MPTARAIAVLATGQKYRPRAVASISLAREALDRLTDSATPISDIRFVGWTSGPAGSVPDGCRCAMYEADYAQLMPRVRRSVCTEPGCPTITSNARCPDHARQVERARGPRSLRLDAAHDRLRRELTPLVNTGTVICWRCRLPIAAGAPWDLGHNDTDRSRHEGPEHRRCNRATTGREHAPNDYAHPGG